MSCRSRYFGAEGNVNAFANDTLVADYVTDSGGSPSRPGGIPPYPRPGNTDIPACAAPPICYSGAPSTAYMRCDQWRQRGSIDAPEGVFSCSAPHAQIDFNCYTDLGTLYTFPNLCDQLGFQAVQVHRQFHGNYGWTSEYWRAPTACDWASGMFPTCVCRAESMNPDQTKYLTLKVYEKINAREGMSSAIHTSERTRKVSVGATTGIVTLDEWTDSIDSFCGGSFGGGGGFVTPPLPHSTIDRYVDHFLRFLTSGTLTVSRSGSTWTAVIADGGPDNGLVQEQITCDFSSTFERKIYGHDAVTGSWIVLEHEVASLSNTVADYTYEHFYGYDSGNTGAVADCGRYQYQFISTYSNPNTAGAVYSDMLDNLLTAWVYHDAHWRTDGFLSVAILMTRSEIPRDVTLDYTLPTDAAWVDPSAGHFDGSIKGGMGKISQQHFSWDHRTYKHCLAGGIDTGPYVSEAAGWGAWSNLNATGDPTDAAMPRGVTQWTESAVATVLRPGRWVSAYQSPLQEGGIWLQDWREIAIPRPAQNWGRPCGMDAFLMDEDTVRCIVDASGDASSCVFKVAETYAARTPHISAGNTVLVYRHSSLDGVWSVDSVSGTSITAHKVASLPVSFSYAAWEANPIIGKLRYPSAGACDPKWNSDSQGDYVRCTYEFNYRDFQERLRFVLDDGTDGPDAGCSGCTAGGSPIRKHQATHGMPREVSSFSAAQMNYAASRCPVLKPADFPGTFTVDETYGSLWQSVVVQWMPELYWQSPHKSCGLILEDGDDTQDPLNYWSEAPSGTDFCPSDGAPPDTYYFPQRPWVECRISVPAGAPSLPAGIYVNALSLSDLDTSGSPPGGVLYVPPGPSGGIAVPDETLLTPWKIHAGECSCIGAAGRFGPDYSEQGVVCPL
jgi:hypothetical protein